MKRRKLFLRSAADDRGAALLMVLVIVTVIGLVGAALLTLSDTSIRTTVALRDQGAAAYAADGAAQVAVDQLSHNKFNNVDGECVTAASGLSLPNFYPGPNGAAASSAYVSCTPDDANGTGGDSTSANASPGNAILTLGTGTGDEDGIYIDSRVGPMKVHGGVFSNSTINVKRGGLQNTSTPSSYNLARLNCTNENMITPAADTTCDYVAPDPRGTDPGTITPHGASYDAPPPPTAAGTISSCNGGATYQKVTPGRLTSSSALNNLTGCSKHIVNFAPGTYYFDLDGTGVWTIDNLYVIAGTPTIPLAQTPTLAQMANACVLPQAAAATTSSGVRFVFGGDSRVKLTDNGNQGGQLTMCASKSLSGPPIAIYGLKTALGGSYQVSAQSGCITNPNTGCPLIYTGNAQETTMTIQGTVYAPKAWMDLHVDHASEQVFQWGLIVRALSIAATNRADLSAASVDIPDAATNPTPVPSIMYLGVYVCPASATCSADPGKLRYRAKVQVVSSTPPTTVKVLSWSVQR